MVWKVVLVWDSDKWLWVKDELVRVMDKKLNNVSFSKYKTCVPDIFFFWDPTQYRHPDNNMDTMACPLGVCINQVPLYCTVIGMFCQLLIPTSM